MLYVGIANEPNLYWQGRGIDFGGRLTAWCTDSTDEANRRLLLLRQKCGHNLVIEERSADGDSRTQIFKNLAV